MLIKEKLSRFLALYWKQLILSFLFLVTMALAISVPSIAHMNYLGTYLPTEKFNDSGLNEFTLHGNGKAELIIGQKIYPGTWFVSISGDDYYKSAYNIKWENGTRQFWCVERGSLCDQSTNIIFKKQ